MNWSTSFIVIVAFVFFMFYYSQTKFKNKMLCMFIRPNRQRIEKWVPLYSKYIVFDRGKYGKGHYICDPNCITLMWYARGFNKFFPILVPTLEFKWDTPNPLDPKTFEHTWHTPEARNASWEEQQHIAYSKGIATQIGAKSKIPGWLLPAVSIVLLLGALYLFQQGIAGLDQRLFDLEQLMKLQVE